MKIEHIKLYHFPMSRSARVKWCLHEIFGDDFEVIRPALYRGEQYQPEFLARNPNHAVPVLEIRDSDGQTTTMIESGAMVSMLADLYPEKQLAPAADHYSPARVEYLQMLHFGASWMDMMLWQIRLHRDLLPEADRDPRTIERNRQKIATEVEPQLTDRLASGGFVCGDRFSAADCILGHNVMWARAYQLCGGAVFDGYLSRLSARSAYQAAFSDLSEFSHKPG